MFHVLEKHLHLQFISWEVIDFLQSTFNMNLKMFFFKDFFQPLHAGNEEDMGGNSINITFSNKWMIDKNNSNLHWCWDHLVLLHWMSSELKTDNITLLYEFFLNKIKANETFLNEYLNRKVDFIAIAEDSRAIVLSDVYGTMVNYDFNNLDIKYANDTIGLIQNRIMKSGLQMASILNQIFDERTKNKANYCNGPSIFLLILATIFYLF
jgi:hypothetical protein